MQADLLVVGTRTGSNRAFPSLARRLGVGAQVRFLGSVPDSEMPGIYRSCDAYVHPTFSDHCSLVVLEALACGLPVVTTRQNGAAELMCDGREGFVLDRADDVGALGRRCAASAKCPNACRNERCSFTPSAANRFPAARPARGGLARRRVLRIRRLASPAQNRSAGLTFDFWL